MDAEEREVEIVGSPSPSVADAPVRIVLEDRRGPVGRAELEPRDVRGAVPRPLVEARAEDLDPRMRARDEPDRPAVDVARDREAAGARPSERERVRLRRRVVRLALGEDGEAPSTTTTSSAASAGLSQGGQEDQTRTADEGSHRGLTDSPGWRSTGSRDSLIVTDWVQC
jgi:hypothetical protein